MCLSFLNLKVGTTIVSDMIFGTSQGEVLTQVKGQIVLLNGEAHKGAVNCMKVTERISKFLNVITGGEDGFVKIWTTTLKLLQVIDMRTSIPDLLKDYRNQKCFGV